MNITPFKPRYSITYHDESKNPTFQKEQFHHISDAVKRFKELDALGFLPVMLTENPRNPEGPFDPKTRGVVKLKKD